MALDVMIDTEFLSLQHNAFLLSVGAVAWDMQQPEYTPIQEFQVFCDLDSQVKLGGSIDSATFAWWLSQDDQARHHMAIGQVASHPIRFVLRSLADFIGRTSPVRVWSHGLACDVPLLAHWFNKTGMATPWNYRILRDTRTVFDMCGVTPPKNFGNTCGAHDALADATVQGEQVHQVWKTHT